MKTARSSLSSLAPWLVFSVAATGCVSVEVEIPEVTVTQHDLAFEGMPIAAMYGDASMTRSFSQMHERLDLPEGLDAEVHALGISLKATRGVADLAFIRNLRVTMNDGVHDPVEIVDYQRQPGAAASDVLDMSSANPVDTLDQWKTDSATFTLEVVGALPADPWAVDLMIRFAGKARYQR